MYRLKKSLGQHFLKDEDMCRQIVEAMPVRAGMKLLEIGPGGGALTKYLLTIPGIQFIATEIDLEKVVYLRKTYPEMEGKLIHGDFLLVDSPFDSPFSIIGNFPYNISSQILFRILDWKDLVDNMVGMFQKEVAARIVAKNKTKDYGILSVLVQAYYEVEYLWVVNEDCFQPPPKVKSAVIRMKRNQNPYEIHSEKRFLNLVKTAFNQRRKTLRN
ncbi:MAG: 16S rRNA (adenine(1518)-N(6)/adenine(1519)-N(6))-dimethyltransferase RsmA, partial [Chitinophagaceae bacterium]